MKLDVEKAMIDYGNSGFNGIEIPDFCKDESMVVFYRPDMLREDDIIDLIDKMPELLSNGEQSVSWDDGFAHVEAYDFLLQGYDAKYLDAYVMGLGEWVCFLQCVVIVDDETKDSFTYSDMYDMATMEMRRLGIMSD